MRQQLKLIRYRDTGEETFGHLVDEDNTLLAITLEDTWCDNQQRMSCIPVGVYQCRPHNGTKYKDVWEVCDVPGRQAILIHNGNTRYDTIGCILVGSAEGSVGGLPAIINSRKTLDKLRDILPDEFELEICEASLI